MFASLLVIVYGAFITITECRPSADNKILNYESQIKENGYNFKFKTSDGITREESGEPVNGIDGALKVTGKFENILPDGYKVSVVFIADEKGYRPKFTIEATEKIIPATYFHAEGVLINKSISSNAIASLAGGGLG